MRRLLLKHFPSMFHRRLLLMMAVVVGVAMVLGAATARLTVGPQQKVRQAAAESVLRSRELIPTVRGPIRDRRGRVLAEDEPAFDVAVDYRVISGQWAYEQARRAARQADRERYRETNRHQRELLIAEYESAYRTQVDAMWQILTEIGEIDADEIDRRRTAVLRRVQQIAGHHALRRQRDLRRRLDEEISFPDAFEPVREHDQAHVILYDIGADARRLIQGFLAESEMEQRNYWQALRKDNDTPDTRALQVWQCVKMERPERRRYPFETMTVMVPTEGLPAPLVEQLGPDPVEVAVEGVGLHLIGLTREAWAEDVRARPFDIFGDLGGYRDGDRVGRFGVESMCEQTLRGTRGLKVKHLDTNTEKIEPARRGGDVTLSIDIQLQAQIQAIMSPGIGLMKLQPWHTSDPARVGRIGEPLNGAAVVMEIDSGDIVAAVSVPTFSLHAWRWDREAIFQNQVDAPFRNRVIAQPYQPGSTVKPLVAAAVYTERELSPGELVDTPGYLWPNKPTVYRDWRYKRGGEPFGLIDGVFAITRSSNVFFGLMAQRLGAARMTRWYEAFGLGQRTGCGLAEEHTGELPAPQSVRRQWGWEFMAIGQGAVRWTPLQAVSAYAALARGGSRIRPRLVLENPPVLDDPIDLDPSGVGLVLKGMYRSANTPEGTSHHIAGGEVIFNTEGVVVRAKSGTAQAVPLREAYDDDGDGRPDGWGRVLRDGDHAWIIALLHAESISEPTHVVAVVVEYSGSGGLVAGPIANQIVRAMKQEGYL